MLSALLLPLPRIVDILLETNHDAAASRERRSAVNDMAQIVVSTLAILSPIHHRRDGTMEEYDIALHGPLDLIAATCDPAEIHSLFKNLAGEGRTDGRDAFILKCCGLLINRLDSHILTELLLPICHRSVSGSTRTKSLLSN